MLCDDDAVEEEEEEEEEERMRGGRQSAAVSWPGVASLSSPVFLLSFLLPLIQCGVRL